MTAASVTFDIERAPAPDVAHARPGDIRAWNPVATEFVANPATAEVYRRQYGVFRDLYPQTRDLMQKSMDRYKTGVYIQKVTLQSVQPPDKVQAAFDDAVKAAQDRYGREKVAAAIDQKKHGAEIAVAYSGDYGRPVAVAGLASFGPRSFAA